MHIETTAHSGNVDEVVDEIQELFETFGKEDYDGEPVSQASHMLQCGMHAINEDKDTELVLGGFLHDIGHLLRHKKKTEAMGTFGVVNHEGIGADFLKERGFSDRICAVVSKHVDAKRYLVATDPAYAAKLSVASQETLKWQGGPMNEEEVKAFKSQPFFDEIITVRLWDEKAKDYNAKTLPLEYFFDLMWQYLTDKTAA